MRKPSSIALLSALTLLAVVAVTTPATLEAKTTAVTVFSIAVIALSLLIERFKPFRRSWNTNNGDLSGDLASLTGIFGLLDGALRLLAPLAAIALFGDLTSNQFGVPLPVEILLVTFVIELGAWLVHWLHHTQTALWRTHAIHHSTERLYTLNNFRFHPINHIANALAIVFLPLVLGFSEESILIYTAISTPVLVLQHANIDLEFGQLNRVLNTNEVHRWHHSTADGHLVCNLGRALTIWDHAFGTYIAPIPASAPNEIGLTGYSKERVPPAKKFWAQLRYPFTSVEPRKAKR